MAVIWQATHILEVEQANERLQKVDVVRLGNVVAKYAFVKPRTVLEEAREALRLGNLIGEVVVDKPVLLEKGDTKLGLCVELCRCGQNQFLLGFGLQNCFRREVALEAMNTRLNER